MATIVQTGFKLAQTVISNGAVTGNQWSNPNNLLLTDGDVAESNPGAGVASDVIIGNFLANVPSNAVITGIELQIIGYAGSQTSPVLTLTPVAVDNTSGTDQYYPYVTPFTGLTPTLASYILGSPTYLFATSWTPDMINNFKLMLVANGDLYIDTALLNVYYYVPDEILPPPPPPTSCDDCNSPVQAQAFYLAQPLLAGDRYMYLQSFNYPDGTPIQYSDLGSCGGSIKFVLDEGVPKVGTSNFEENVQTALWTVQPDGTVKFDFVDIDTFRGLMFHTPYTADPSLRSNHDANSKVIISNSGPFYGQYLQRCNIGSTVSAPIQVKQEGSTIVNPAVKLNFKGAVVVVPNGSDATQADITIEGTAPATPIVTSSGSSTSGNVQVSTLVFDMTTSGINRGLLVQVSTEAAPTITGVTFNGVPLVQEIGVTDGGNNLQNTQWFLLAPPLGTFPVVITLSAPAYISAGAEALVSVNQTTPIGASSRNTGTSFNPSVALTTTADNSNVFDGLTTAQTPILYTPGPDQVLNWSATANADTRQGSSSYLPAGTSPDSITMQYTITQNTPWAMTAVEIIGTFPPSPSDHQVLVDGLDTTPGFLASKLNLHSSDSSVIVTPSVTNPGGDEIQDYDFTRSVGGEIILQQIFLFSDFVNDGSGNGLATFTDAMPLGAVPSGVRYDITVAFDPTSQMEVLDSEASGQIIGSLVPADAIATVIGKTDGAAVFDWTATPNPVVKIPGIVPSMGSVTVSIIGSGSSGQNAIQFEDETGADLGTQGTVTELELAGDSFGTRTANKVTYLIGAMQIHQVAHGLSEGNIIKSNGSDNEFALALGDNAADAEVVGIVITVIDADNFIYSQNIMGYSGAGIPSGTPGEGVFLDQATPGAMTLTPDTSTTGLVVKAVGVLIAGSGAKMNFSSSYLGLINP